MSRYVGAYQSGGASVGTTGAGVCCAYHNLTAVILGAVIAASILILLCLDAALALILLLFSGAVPVVSRAALGGLWLPNRGQAKAVLPNG